MKSLLISISVLLIVFSANTFANDSKNKQINELAEKVRLLEERIGKIEQYLKILSKEQQSKNISLTLQDQVTKRFELDKTIYTKEQLGEIEHLYQIANRSWDNPETQKGLHILIDKYPKANRTGCALLYLAQMNYGGKKEKFLKQAIENHSDCVYGDAVQVGAFARLLLADYYSKSGKQKEADALINEILNDYPDAVDHNGKLIKEMIKR